MNLYQTTTDHVLQQLESVVPWRQTWSLGLPRSLTTGQRYRGVNLLVLGTTGFSSPYWVTADEVQRLGGQVRAGESPARLIDWRWQTAAALDPRLPDTPSHDPALTRPVFNLDQTEGLARPEPEGPRTRHALFARAEQLWQAMPARPEIVHEAVTGSSYQAQGDQVVLPQLSFYTSAEHYYGLFFEALVRATGHPQRLNRFPAQGGPPPERYDFEALVGELGAAFMCAAVGLGRAPGEAGQAEALAGWRTALRADPRLVIRAAAAAQQGVDYLRGLPVSEEVKRGLVREVTATVGETVQPGPPGLKPSLLNQARLRSWLPSLLPKPRRSPTPQRRV